MNRLARLIVSGFLWVALPLSASLFQHAELYFGTLTPEDKAVAGAITALAQDHEGFIWIGTQHGLVRFDGYQYLSFKSDPQDPNALHSHFISSLLVAADGRIWVGSRSEGLAIFDPKKGTFKNFRHDDSPDSLLPGNKITSMLQDSRGRIWVATNAGLLRKEPDSEQFQVFRHDDQQPGSLPDDRLLTLLQDAEGELYIGSYSGLAHWQEQQQQFERLFDTPKEQGGFAKQPIYRILQTHGNIWWISIPTMGVIRLDRTTGQMTHLSSQLAPPFQLQQNWVTSMVQVSDNELWLGTNGGGISIVNIDTGEVIRTQLMRHGVPGTLLHNDIGALLKDASGMIWIGTWGAGIQLFNPANQALRILRAIPEDPHSLSDAHVLNVLQRQNGEIWIGTQGNGLDVFMPELGKVRHYAAQPGQPGALQSASIQGLAETRDGQLWVGTLQSGLYRYQPELDNFVHYAEGPVLPSGQIRRLKMAPGNDLWVGTFIGLYRWRADTDSFQSFYKDPNRSYKLSSSILALWPESSGGLWVGTVEGLFYCEPESDIATPIAVGPSGLALQINDITQDSHGRLILSTPQGLFTNSPEQPQQFDSVNAKLGLDAMDLGSNLLMDVQQRLWTATHLIDLQAGTVHEWSKADGVDFGVPWDGAHAVLADGSLAIGGTKGVLLIEPQSYQPWSFAPKLGLAALSIDGQAKWLNPEKPLALPADSQSVSLTFSAFDFSMPELNRYRYQLQGFDTDWRLANAQQRTATYTNLDPGRYEFVVQGSNRNGQWSDQQLRVQVIKLPRWYQQDWVRGMFAGAVLGLFYLLYRFRLQQLVRSEQQLQQKVAEKTQQLEVRNQQLQQALAEVRKSALTDALTGLGNRRYLYEVLPADMARSLRQWQADPQREDSRLLFFLLDIDFFKQVNDQYGHQSGDLVLVQFAQILRQCFRESDVLVRWGGEEFLVVCRDAKVADAVQLAERLLTQVAKHPFVLADGNPIHRTCSLGISCFPACGAEDLILDWQQLIALADVALYDAKHHGRNTWRVCQVDAALTATQQQLLATAPEQALQQGLLQLLGPSG